MSTPESLSARFGPAVSELQAAVAGGDESAFRAAFDQLRERLNAELNPELVRITETAQAALGRFRDELRIETLAGQEVPDARKRLAHVLDLTDEAAHRTLDLVEKSGPLVEQTARGAVHLLEQLRAGALASATDGSFVQLAAYLERARADAEAVRANLSGMLMAQGFQDITGQILRSVIKLVTELEAVLTDLVLLADGTSVTVVRARRIAVADDASRGVGPQVPGTTTHDAVGGQDDIDALLMKFGG